MADGLQFYQLRNVPRLEDCQSTIEFCLWMNSLFDALNEKVHGVTPGDHHFTVSVICGFITDVLRNFMHFWRIFHCLENSSRWLDEWETKVNEGVLPKSSYLTRETAEGLRVALRPTIDLIVAFTNAGFDSICTGRINQDPLEV